MVLIRYDHDEGEHSMVNHKVARIHLLFTTVDSESDEQLNLAFIQLFRTVEPTDHWTGMFKVKTLEKYEVVEVDSIERGVHLIPCFIGHETEMASANTVSALDNYDEFWINNYSDSHMYNTIYT